MQSNSFFLKRAIARGPDWHVAYPALSLASSIDPVDENRKQIIVAAADERRMRMVFFSSLGSILDFQATWSELQGATTWLAFTLRWNRWWLPDIDTQRLLEKAAYRPNDVRIANRPLAGNQIDGTPFSIYLAGIESSYRRDASISRVLFPPSCEFADATI
jgi:hypothetical protein